MKEKILDLLVHNLTYIFIVLRLLVWVFEELDKRDQAGLRL